MRARASVAGNRWRANMAHVRQTRPDPEWLQVKRSEDVLNCSFFGRMQAVPEFTEIGEGARERGGVPLDVAL